MTRWIEVLLGKGQRPSLIYEIVGTRAVSFHHFQDEPWWPKRYVVRIEADSRRMPGIRRKLKSRGFTFAAWDPSDDERQFGADWDAVRAFFEVGSLLAETGASSRHLSKMIHCLLNQAGLSVSAEYLFAREFARGRRRQIVHDLYYAKVRPGHFCRHGCHPVGVA